MNETTERTTLIGYFTQHSPLTRITSLRLKILWSPASTRVYALCDYPIGVCPTPYAQEDTGIRDARGNWTIYHPIGCGTGNFRDASGNQTVFTYDSHCNRNTIKDPNENKTTIVYNDSGDITSIIDAECDQQNPKCQTTFTYWPRDGMREIT